MNQHQFSNEEVVLNQDVKLGAASFVHTFGDVNEPSIKCTAGVAVLDVIANVIGGQFRDLRVDLISAEVVILDVPGQHGGVTFVGVAGASLGGGGATDDGLHLDVFHRLRFHVPILA